MKADMLGETTAGPRSVSATSQRMPLPAWWVLLFCASAALYWPGLRGGYFSDDLLFFFYSPPPHWWDYFATRGAAAQAYRPLEAIILTAIQQRFWFNTLPIHLLSLAAHAGLICAVLMAARRLALKPVDKLLACAFGLVAQVNAPAVLGNDTLSQSASAMLGSWSVLLLAMVWLERKESAEWKIRPGWLLGSAALYAASVLFKETGLGYLAVAALLIVCVAFEEPGWPARWRTAVTLALPYGAVTLLYWLARMHAGAPTAESGSYRIHVGLNILRNLGEFALAAFGPVSTVNGAIALEQHSVPDLAFEAVGWFVVVAVVAIGLCISSRRRLCVGLLGLAVAALFPAYLLTHVSELYLYNAVPFLALVFGIALGSIWRVGAKGKAAVVASAGLLLIGQMLAGRQKAELMARNGRSAARIYTGLEPYLRTLPRGGEIVLVNTPDRAPEYSVFLLKGFDVVDLGNLRIGPIFGRPDVRVEVVDQARISRLPPRADRVYLGLSSNGGVESYTGPMR
ncbi:MAG: hypothetical protein JOZ22_03230 [Acidobacteriia bacterium]|nr:hypothetical protein [Terriglobia bacterium]